MLWRKKESNSNNKKIGMRFNNFLKVCNRLVIFYFKGVLVQLCVKMFSSFFFNYLDSMHGSWGLTSFPREQFKKNRSIMCNKKWDFRELKDTERKEGKIRYWEFLFRA